MHGRSFLIGAHALLALHLLIWYGWLAPPARLAALAIALVPLGLSLACTLRPGRLGPVLAGYLAFGYLAHGLTELIANPPERAFAAMELVLSALLLGASIAALRGRQHRLDERDGEPPLGGE
ncbi:MAG TPA: DUF2069 domain-containing protein [Gammaproteobacteria bacterium]|nr:DUF2069 domain-containing protein [Gammaproteobacteria bacterium]